MGPGDDGRNVRPGSSPLPSANASNRPPSRRPPARRPPLPAGGLRFEASSVRFTAVAHEPHPEPLCPSNPLRTHARCLRIDPAESCPIRLRLPAREQPAARPPAARPPAARPYLTSLVTYHPHYPGQQSILTSVISLAILVIAPLSLHRR